MNKFLNNCSPFSLVNIHFEAEYALTLMDIKIQQGSTDFPLDFSF